MPIKKRIFIVGSPRSGTTLLQNLLANQVYINTFPETHFFHTLCNQNIVFHKLNVFPNLKTEVLIKSLSSELQLKPNKVKNKNFFNKYFYGYWIRLFSQILDKDTLNNSKEVWIEKTPLHLHYIPIIENYIENTHFIHILRNGLDVVASVYNYSKKHSTEWSGERSIDQCLNRWKRDIQFSKENIHKPNHSFLLYEDLVSEKRTEVLSSLFIELDLHYNKTLFNEIDKDIFTKTVQDFEPWKKGVLNKIENTNGKLAQGLFTSQEIDYIHNSIKNTDLSFF